MRTARGPPQRRCHAGAELGARIPSVTTATGVETAAVALRRAAPQPRGDPVLSTDTAGSSTLPGPRASLAPITAARRDLPPPDLPLSRFPIAQRPPGPRSHLLFTFQTTAVSADARRMRSQLRDPPAPPSPPPLAPPGASARGSAQAAAKAHCSPTQLRGGFPTTPHPPMHSLLSPVHYLQLHMPSAQPMVTQPLPAPLPPSSPPHLPPKQSSRGGCIPLPCGAEPHSSHTQPRAAIPQSPFNTDCSPAPHTYNAIIRIN